jgi:predicted GNAT family N-acyltransferase
VHETTPSRSRGVRIRFGIAAEVLHLRHAILRAGLPRETAIFAGDDDPNTKHVVATLNRRVVGCATVHLNSYEGNPAWQLRGMATDSAFRGSGVGRAMLAFLETSLRESNIQQMWCNARVPAIKFYEYLGWTVVSDVFEVPTAGPHVKMVKTLTRLSPAQSSPT